MTLILNGPCEQPMKWSSDLSMAERHAQSSSCGERRAPNHKQTAKITLKTEWIANFWGKT